MNAEPLKTMSTGVPNLDSTLGGGIPFYSVNIIAGPSGSGKTILTQQMLFHNCQDGKRGIFFTTLSEPAFKMIRYQQHFSYFDLARLNEDVFYVDIGQTLRHQGLVETLAAINNHVQQHQASFVAIDSFKAIHDLAGDRTEARRFAYDLAVGLSAWTCTSFLVGEYTETEILNEPVFAVADGIVYLTNPKKGMQNVRRLNVSKMRGMDYFTGDHPFAISSDGISVFPRIKTPPSPPVVSISGEQVSTGIEGLDEMMHGGIPRGSVTLTAGGAGTGKTLISLHFVVQGIEQGEPGLFVTFQETPDHLEVIAEGFGWDLQQYIDDGLLKILYTSPVEMGVDEHTRAIQDAIDEIDARRVVIDSLMDIQIATPDKVRFKDYVYSLVAELRNRGITSMLTNEIPELFGPLQLSSHGISFMSDNVVLLRYVEIASVLRRGISVMKMRGQDHDKAVREFSISSRGLQIDGAFGEWVSILSGQPAPYGRLSDDRPRTRVAQQNRAIEALAQSGRMSESDLAEYLNIPLDQMRKFMQTLVLQGFAQIEGMDNSVYYEWKG